MQLENNKEWSLPMQNTNQADTSVPLIGEENSQLELARLLVSALEANDSAQADALITELNTQSDHQLFQEVGQLTRELHDAINGFLLDDRVSELAHDEIPDATERLQFVIKTTEDAANTTLTAVEEAMPLVDNLLKQSHELAEEWEDFRNRKLNVEDFKQLSDKLSKFMSVTQEHSESLQLKLTDITMAQGFQDITGQIIKRVIALVQDLEERLINLVKVSGKRYTDKHDESDPSILEGPVIPGVTKGNTVQGQDDVDDLLSSLGF